MGSSTYNASWRELLAAPPRGSHVVQIYDCHDFVASAVGHFAAEGLQRGEVVLLSGTPQHLAGALDELARSGIATQSAVHAGQLVLGDVHKGLEAASGGGPIERAKFAALVDDALARARSDTRFTGVRWWGEFANTVYHLGDRESALVIETEADAAARKHGATIFCSSLCDRFDAAAYDGMLPDMCRTHSHVIPADDYVEHRLAVNRAIRDVIGPIEGSLLQSLSTWRGLGCSLPSSQALLFWLRESLPEHFNEVLASARAYRSREPGPHDADEALSA